MATPEEIGKIFIEARERRNLSPAEASRESRIHPDVITDIEGGTFDRLGKIYIKSFLKKYSEFLALDPEDILSKYKTIAPESAGLQFDLSELDKEKVKWSKVRKISAKKPEENQGKKNFTAPKLAIPKITIPRIKIPKIKIPEIKIPRITIQKLGFTRKQVEAMAIAGLSLVLILLISNLLGKVKSKVSSREKGETVVIAKTMEDKIMKKVVAVPAPKVVKPVVEKPAPKKIIAPPVEEKVEKKIEKKVEKKVVPPVQVEKPAPVALNLRARGEVWIQVRNAKKVLFEGTLRRGDRKMWKSDNFLKVWVGKGEKLDFFVNSKRIGRVARGVAKDIQVSAKGVKVAGKWFSRL